MFYQPKQQIYSVPSEVKKGLSVRKLLDSDSPSDITFYYYNTVMFRSISLGFQILNDVIIKCICRVQSANYPFYLGSICIKSF